MTIIDYLGGKRDNNIAKWAKSILKNYNRSPI